MNIDFSAIFHICILVTSSNALIEFTNPVLKWFSRTDDFEMLSVEGISTRYLYNFRCRTYIAKCFKYYNLHPEISSVAPHEFCNVTFPDGLQIDTAETYPRNMIKEQPTVVWRTNESVPYYSLVMQNPDDPEIFRGSHAWLVVNIPGCDIAKGNTVLRYVEPCLPPTRERMRIGFLVFEQHRKFSMDEMDYDEERNWWFEANDFADRYNLSYAKFGNFYLLND